MKVTPVRMKPRPVRTRAERLLMILPRPFRLNVLIMALPSRLRRPALAVILDHGFAAVNRQDYEFIGRLLYHPDFSIEFAEDPGPDLERRYAGRDAAFAAYARWLENWGGLKRDPVGCVDRGDHIVVLARERMRGKSSGVQIDREVGIVVQIRSGLVVSQKEYRTWAEALA